MHAVTFSNANSVSNTTTEALEASRSAPASFSEEHIQTLINLGSTRERAIIALRRTNGNVEMAASTLF